MFAYAIVVLPFHQFSALAGAFALAIMMLPLVMRTTEELLLLVPQTLREGALALGRDARARRLHRRRAGGAARHPHRHPARAGARRRRNGAAAVHGASTTAYFSTDPRQPISTLTVQVYTYATSAYDDWHRQAWAGALVLVTIVLTCSLLARVATARMEKMQRGS